MYQYFIKIYTIFVIFNISIITSEETIKWEDAPMTWPEVENDNDLFADRVVSINLDLANYLLPNGSANPKKHTVIATGVLISNQQVLTAYNPFRHFALFNDIMKSIIVGALKERIYHQTNVNFIAIYVQIACGRQVIPMRDEDIQEDDWHGKDGFHSPLHDLMVLRVAKNFTLQDKHEDLNTKIDAGSDTSTKLAGPLLTVLAKPGQAIGRNVKIASIGHKSDKHIKKNFDLLRHDYEPEENVIVDCDQWIPRQWGHFICVRNVNDFEALASGAVLFYNSTLYGIGSFALKKGKKGVLVFTDVRRYYGLISETCTVADQI